MLIQRIEKVFQEEFDEIKAKFIVKKEIKEVKFCDLQETSESVIPVRLPL